MKPLSDKQISFLDKRFKMFMLMYLKNSPKTREILSALFDEIKIINYGIKHKQKSELETFMSNAL